jgi:uncharacterized protein
MWTLIIFTRWPVAGHTKTRLIPEYGAEGAANIHRQLIARTVAAARALRADVRVVVALADAPHDANATEFFDERWPCIAQRGENLGERMANAIDDALHDHKRSHCAVLVGVDCPDYSAAVFEQAATALQSHNIVYAPTEDGGYGLVGVTRDAWNAQTRSAMFNEIAWGTSSVFETSRERIRCIRHASHERGVAVATLPTIWDVDTASDVARAVALGYLDATTTYDETAEKQPSN